MGWVPESVATVVPPPSPLGEDASDDAPASLMVPDPGCPWDWPAPASSPGSFAPPLLLPCPPLEFDESPAAPSCAKELDTEGDDEHAAASIENARAAVREAARKRGARMVTGEGDVEAARRLNKTEPGETASRIDRAPA